MFGTVIVQVIIYSTLIALIHHLYLFFQNNLTTPKIKDLVNKPAEHYKQMYQTMNYSNQKNTDDPVNNNVHNNVQMKDEMKKFFKSLNDKKQPDSVAKISDTLSSSVPDSSLPIALGDTMQYSAY